MWVNFLIFQYFERKLLMSKSIQLISIFLTLCVTCVSVPVVAQEAANPFLGRWALTIPGGGAGWHGVAAHADPGHPEL